MNELRDSIGFYLSDISSVLNRVPRQLLLILKTNDLLRCIDHQLQTSKASRSFITMSKCCVEAVAREELRTCDSWVGRLKTYMRWSIANARIALYQLSVQDYSLSSDLWGSIAANLFSLSLISLFVGVSWPTRALEELCRNNVFAYIQIKFSSVIRKFSRCMYTLSPFQERSSVCFNIQSIQFVI